MLQFVEEAIVPDSIKHLFHIKKGHICRLLILFEAMKGLFEDKSSVEGTDSFSEATL